MTIHLFKQQQPNRTRVDYARVDISRGRRWAIFWQTVAAVRQPATDRSALDIGIRKTREKSASVRFSNITVYTNFVQFTIIIRHDSLIN